MTLSRLAAPLDIGGVRLANRVFLAPMSGVTDAPFRRRAHVHGAGLVVSEMIAGGELARGRAGSLQRLRQCGLPVYMVQIAGCEAAPMAAAARIAAAEGATIIDINMGCPAKKVTGGYAGSALMRDIDHALVLIEAVIAAVDVPVSVKMRLGWDETALNAPLLARRAEEAGAQMVTVHGRTRCQLYRGKADWRSIARVRQAVSIPVVVNGDVATPEDAEIALEQSGADAVMIGRAHYGAPWTAGLIAKTAAGQAMPDMPGQSAMGAYVLAHYEDMLSFYGVERGVRQARKHLGWYLDRHFVQFPDEWRRQIMTATSPTIVMRRLANVFGEAPESLSPGLERHSA